MIYKATKKKVNLKKFDKFQRGVFRKLSEDKDLQNKIQEKYITDLIN